MGRAERQHTERAGREDFVYCWYAQNKSMLKAQGRNVCTRAHVHVHVGVVVVGENKQTSSPSPGADAAIAARLRSPREAKAPVGESQLLCLWVEYA